MSKLSSFLHASFEALYRRLSPKRYKQYRELFFWKGRAANEPVLVNDHFAFFYTGYFGLDEAFYTGKRVLDIGCGPRGSLEWAGMAAERVGLDPLANEYLKLGAGCQQMKYIAAPAEEIPFADGYFDVVSSFNSLDHVDDLWRSIAEIKCVVKPGGLFLLIVEANHPAMVTEPVTFGWNDTALFEDVFRVESCRRYEIGDSNIYGQLAKNAFFDPSLGEDRAGFLAVKFGKRG
ncbi:MAG: class I SAM-dependent methyltransferase [Anaerolineaceae bacterium]